MKVDGGVDRISRLPDEILFVILSFLRVREAASTTVLSSRWLDLWKQNPNLKFDRISQLPDEILLVILSSLSLKEVVATSVLSSRWSHLWKCTPDLYFDRIVCITNLEVPRRNTFWDVERFSRIVNAVIQSHKALSLKSLRFFFRLSNSDKCAVAKWLEVIFSRRVESLQLYFESTVADELVLEELLRESGIFLQPQTDIFLFQSLKRLCLGCLKISGEDIELFLHNCPLLEQLEILLAILTSDVEVCGAKLMLKDLNIYGCKGEKSIKIFAPNLTYMRFSDESEKLLFENVPKLVEASFCVDYSFTARSDGVVRLFASPESCYFSQLQVLFLKFWENKTFCQLLVILANEFTQMPNLKQLVIFCAQPYNHSVMPITALIWAYPRLEELTLEFSGCLEFEPTYMQVMTHDGRSPHQHLKLFRLQISRRQTVGDDMAELVTYISDNCAALRKIVIGHDDQHDATANKNYLTERLQGKIPNHIQLELFNPTM